MQIPQNAKYADAIRIAMKSRDNASGGPLSTREISRRLGYSYEHVRKVTKGEPVVSAEFNEALSKLLGLDPRDMWTRAQKEKVQRRFKGVPVDLQPPSDAFFAEIWPKLTPEDIDTLKKIAQGMVLQNQARNQFEDGASRRVLAGSRR